MAFRNNEKITRRTFVKGAAGAAVCCASFSPDCLPASKEIAEQDGKAKEHLAAACGTYCGACPAYLAKHGDDEKIKIPPQKRSFAKATKGVPPPSWMEGLLCDGCLSGGMLAAHCKTCQIRLCAAGKQTDSRCSDCKELPCYRITNLINMGNYLHRNEYLPNLAKIRKMGSKEWVKEEEARWRCSQCGVPISWYEVKCPGCGEPRSKNVFPLPESSL